MSVLIDSIHVFNEIELEFLKFMGIEEENGTLKTTGPNAIIFKRDASFQSEEEDMVTFVYSSSSCPCVITLSIKPNDFRSISIHSMKYQHTLEESITDNNRLSLKLLMASWNDTASSSIESEFWLSDKEEARLGTTVLTSSSIRYGLIQCNDTEIKAVDSGEDEKSQRTYCDKLENDNYGKILEEMLDIFKIDEAKKFFKDLFEFVSRTMPAALIEEAKKLVPEDKTKVLGQMDDMLKVFAPVGNKSVEYRKWLREKLYQDNDRLFA